MDANTVALMDSDGQDCGLSALGTGGSIYGRLIFNENEELIGFGLIEEIPEGEPLVSDHRSSRDTSCPR